MNADLNNALRNWYKYENIISEKKTELDLLKTKQNEIKKVLNQYTKDNNLENKIVSVDGNKIKFNVTKSSEPFTIKYLETNLGKIIKNNEQLEKTIDFIKDNREIKYNYGIKLINNN